MAITTSTDKQLVVYPNSDIQNQAVDVNAVNRLSKTALDNRWIAVHSKTGFSALVAEIGYIFERIAYACGLGKLAAEDKACGATITAFNQAAKDLVLAVAKRGMDPAEAIKLGRSPVLFNNDADQENSTQLTLTAEGKLKAFYTLFKKRVEQLEIDENDPQYGEFAKAASKIIKDVSHSYQMPELKNPDVLKLKLKTAVNSLNVRISKDIVQTYASQESLENILLPKSFNEKVDLIKSLTGFDNGAIRTELHNAILKYHPKTADYQKLKDEYLNPVNDDSNKRLKAAKEAIAGKYNPEKAQLEARLHELRGSKNVDDAIDLNNNTGTLRKAWLEVLEAEQKKATAREKYLQERNKFAVGEANISDADLLKLPIVNESLAALQLDFENQIKDLDAKKAAYDVLKKEFDEIAVYQGTNVVGGKLGVIYANLRPEAITTAARAATTEAALFCNSFIPTNANQVNTPNNLSLLDSVVNGEFRNALH